MRQRILVYGGMLLIAAGSLTLANVFLPAVARTLVALVALAAYFLLSRLWLRLLRWRIPVSVTSQCSVAAPPDRAWALLSSAEAWSLRPGSHAFDVPAVAGLPRLRVVTRIVSRPGSRRAASATYELADFPGTAGQPGRTLVTRTAGLPEARAVIQTIQVTPEGSGTRIVVTARWPARLAGALDVRAAWRKSMAAWLRECEAVLAGHRDWPGQAVPPDLLAALAAPLPAGKLVEVSATAAIAVDPVRAWRAIWDPATNLALPESRAVAAGFVPGAPVGRAGEIQYTISRHQRPDSGMLTHLQYVTDFEPGRMAVARLSGLVDCEISHFVAPGPGGTRYNLTCRLAGRKLRKKQEALQAGIEQQVAQLRVLLEGTGSPQRAWAPGARSGQGRTGYSPDLPPGGPQRSE